MKTIYDMSPTEVKLAFEKWIKKHHTDDEYEMSALQMMKYAELLGKANREELLSLISDIFFHGFMCGYKQSKANRKAKKTESEQERAAEECRCNIVKLIQDVASVEWLEKIYFFARAFTEETEDKV